MIAASMLIGASVYTQVKTEAFTVYGNCGMCKSRIEKAAKVDGVTSASWSAETKTITVTYDSTKVSNADIQKKIAAVGHDTEKFSADDKVYKKLPGCCLYDRKKGTKTTDHSGHQH